MTDGLRIETVLGAEAIEAIVTEVTRRVLADLHAERPHGLMSIREAAPMFRLTEGALRKHVQRGNVPSKKIGGRRFVDLGSVD